MKILIIIIIIIIISSSSIVIIVYSGNDIYSTYSHYVAYSTPARLSAGSSRPRRSSPRPVFGNRKAPVSCSVGPDSCRAAGTPTAPAETLPEESPSAKFTLVLAMVGANTDGTDRREDVWGSSSGGYEMAFGTTADTAVTARTPLQQIPRLTQRRAQR